MATFPTYLDVQTFVTNAAHNVEVASLIGLNTVLTGGPYTAGVTALSLANATIPANAPAPTTTLPLEAWLFDGVNSEIVEITNITGTTATLANPTLAAHANGVNVTSAGSMGCLADIIVQSAREVDNICAQGPSGALDRSLYAVSRSETYTLATTRAFVDAMGTLQIWPWHFPVQTLTSIALQLGVVPGNAVDLSAQVVPDGARSIAIPYVGFTSPTSLSGWSRTSNIGLRAPNRWATLVYTAGPIVGSTLAAVPSDIQRATMLLTSDLLAVRKNPVGASNIHRGDESYEFELRGDFSGHSLLYKNAQNRLRQYTRHV